MIVIRSSYYNGKWYICLSLLEKWVTMFTVCLIFIIVVKLVLLDTLSITCFTHATVPWKLQTSSYLKDTRHDSTSFLQDSKLIYTSSQRAKNLPIFYKQTLPERFTQCHKTWAYARLPISLRNSFTIVNKNLKVWSACRKYSCKPQVCAIYLCSKNGCLKRAFEYKHITQIWNALRLFATDGVHLLAAKYGNGIKPVKAYLVYRSTVSLLTHLDNFLDYSLWSGRTVTSLLLYSNILFYVLDVLWKGALVEAGGRNDYRVRYDKQWYRLLSALFLHANIWHITMNLQTLRSIGPLMESAFGSGQMLSIYLLSGIIGNLVSYLNNTYDKKPSILFISIGASGGLFGCVGALVVFITKFKVVLGSYGTSLLKKLISSAISMLLFGLNPTSKIDNFSHLGGFCTGMVLSYLISDRLSYVYLGNGRLRITIHKPLQKQFWTLLNAKKWTLWNFLR